MERKLSDMMCRSFIKEYDCEPAVGDGVKRINDNPTILSHKPSGLTIRMAIFELKKFSLKFDFGKE